MDINDMTIGQAKELSKIFGGNECSGLKSMIGKKDVFGNEIEKFVDDTEKIGL